VAETRGIVLGLVAIANGSLRTVAETVTKILEMLYQRLVNTAGATKHALEEVVLHALNY